MDTQNSNTNSDNTITEEATILDDNNFVLSPFQQWEIAFIYAFITTFNPQADISPSFYKLPSLTPDVCCPYLLSNILVQSTLSYFLLIN
jgi:hypothetical protein